MSVYDREPHVPVTDTGRGLVALGWMWVLGTAIFWFMHPRSDYLPVSFEWLCAILGLIGIALIAVGHFRRRFDREELTAAEVDTIERAQRLDEEAGKQVGTGKHEAA